MGAISSNRNITQCVPGEVLHLRRDLVGADYELEPGFYVLQEMVRFGDPEGNTIRFAVVCVAGESEQDGTLIADGPSIILPGKAAAALVGIGVRALGLPSA